MKPGMSAKPSGGTIRTNTGITVVFPVASRFVVLYFRICYSGQMTQS